MRFIHLADLHIGSPLQTGAADLAARTKEELFQYLEELFSSLDTRKIDLLLLAGDIFEPSSLTKDDLDRFIACLALAKECYILAAAGNHDPLTATSPWQKVLQANLPNFHLFTGAVESLYFPGLKTIVSGFSFTSLYQKEAVLPELENSRIFYRVEKINAEQTWQLKKAELATNAVTELRQANFLLSLVHASPVHPAFAERMDDYNYNPLTEAMMAAAHVDYLALGHFHKPIVSHYWPNFTNLHLDAADASYQAEYIFTKEKRLTVNNSNATCLPTYAGTLLAWPGNIIGRNFGEVGHRGYLLGEIASDFVAKADKESSIFRLSFYPHDLRKFWSLNYDVQALRSQLQGERLQTTKIANLIEADLSQDEAWTKNFYRLTLRGSLLVEEEIDLLALQAKLQSSCPQLTITSELKTRVNWAELSRTNRLAELMQKIAQADKEFQKASSDVQEASLQTAWQALQND